MRHRKEKRIIATFLLVVMTMICILPGMRVMAANPQLVLTSDKATVRQGDLVTISLQVKAAGIQAAAFSANVEISTEHFIVGKVISNLENVYYGDERKNQILLNWYTDENVTFEANETLVQLQLRVSEYAEMGTYEVNLSDVEFYNIKNQKVAVDVETEPLIITVESMKSQEVLDVESLINAIGNVTQATVEVLDKITTAQTAFSSLSAFDKALVENYTMLQDAINTYNRLKEEQEAQDSKDMVAAVLEKFRTDHAAVLALTEETVTIGDQTAVQAGITDYLGQDAYIRKLLKDNEYQKLLDLKTKINSLILEESAITVAQEQVKSFRETYQTLLATTVDMLPTDDLNLIQTLKGMAEEAIGVYQDGYNTIAKEILKENYAWIKTLYERLVELEILNAPDEEWVTEAYNAFREKYLTLLLKTSLDVTEADVSEIQNAIKELKEQRTAVKGKLSNEYEHLMNLLNAVNSQQMGTDVEVQVQKIETIVERVTEKIITVTKTEEGEKKVQVLGVEFTSGGWFGLLVFVINLMTMLLFAIPFIMSYGLRKKKEDAAKHVKE